MKQTLIVHGSKYAEFKLILCSNMTYIIIFNPDYTIQKMGMGQKLLL